MNPDYYGLIELMLSFGLVLVFLFWQLYSTRKAIAEAERKAQEKPGASRDDEPG